MEGSGLSVLVNKTTHRNSSSLFTTRVYFTGAAKLTKSSLLQFQRAKPILQ
jgi:hypothetical protein